MMNSFSWFVYLPIEMLLIRITYHGINLDDYLIRSKPWTREIQKRKWQGTELDEASVASHGMVFSLAMVYYYEHVEIK